MTQTSFGKGTDQSKSISFAQGFEYEYSTWLQRQLNTLNIYVHNPMIISHNTYRCEFLVSCDTEKTLCDSYDNHKHVLMISL